MKLDLGKALKSVVRTAKENPQATLIIGTLLFPGLAKKFVPVIVAATTKPEPE